MPHKIGNQILGIKWNDVTWYSRLGALIVFIGIIPALAFYIGIQYERTITAFQSGSLSTIPEIPGTSVKKTYQNAQYGFEIDIPGDMKSGWQGVGSGASTPFEVGWYFPQSYYGTSTTHSEVDVDITVRDGTCSDDGFTGPIKKIHGIDFHTRRLGLGGDGGISGLDIPVTFYGADKNGLCYELGITSTNNGDMTISEEQKMYSSWLSMLSTFKFY